MDVVNPATLVKFSKEELEKLGILTRSANDPLIFLNSFLTHFAPDKDYSGAEVLHKLEKNKVKLLDLQSYLDEHIVLINRLLSNDTIRAEDKKELVKVTAEGEADYYEMPFENP